MTIKALYRPSEQKLRVEVLNAVNLIPLDSNGECGWAGVPHLPSTPHSQSPVHPWVGKMLALLGVTGLCLALLLHPRFGEEGELLHWSGVVQGAAAGRTLCPHPAAFSVQHEPGWHGTVSWVGCHLGRPPGEVTPIAATRGRSTCGKRWGCSCTPSGVWAGVGVGAPWTPIAILCVRPPQPGSAVCAGAERAAGGG